jgi:peroxiredoxin
MAVTLRLAESPPTVAPDFELESHDGERVRLSQYRGKRVILFFMRAYT